MQCVTVRKGVECTFMTSRGCGFSGGRCLNITEACEGCSNTRSFEDGMFCLVAANPAKKWSAGSCNFATHVQRVVVEETQKLNPLKASKRATGGGKKK